MWHKRVEIISEGTKTDIKVNGKSINGVTYFKLEGKEAGELPELTLKTDIVPNSFRDYDNENEGEVYTKTFSFEEVEEIKAEYELKLAKLKEENEMYISERITNISELEKIIEDCYIIAQLLQKESPHNENFHKLVEKLKQASNFEFNIERRKTSYCQ